MMRNAVLAAISASFLLLPAGTRAADSAPGISMVTVSPAPGVSFQIPGNWIACEPDTEKLLSSAEDALDLKDKFCTRSANVPSVMRVYDPRPFHTLTMILNYHQNQPLSEKAMAAVSEQDLNQLSQPICAAETGPLLANGASPAGCTVHLGSLGGHPAMVSNILIDNPANNQFKLEIVSYELPYPKGYLQVQFSFAVALEKVVAPVREKIIASMQIESAPSAGDAESHGDAPPAKTDATPTPDAAPPKPDAPASAPEGAVKSVI